MLDIRKDLRYIEGFKQGYEEGLEEARNEILEEGYKEVIRRLLRNSDRSIEQIALVLECNIELVERVKNEMQPPK